MSNATKFLLGAVGLIVVVLLCAVIITTMNKGRGSINNSMDSYDNMVSQFDDVKFSVYADAVASGSDIINLIKNLKQSDGVQIEVINKTATVVYDFDATGALKGTDTAGATYTLSAISDKSQANAYINSLGSFDGSVIRDNNGAITKVSFKQR